MKKFFSLTLTLAAMLSAMAVSAQATDYSFETDGTPEYYPSSSYLRCRRFQSALVCAGCSGLLKIFC